MTEKKETFNDMQLVVFRLGNEEFGADISQVREIIRVGEITSIPQAPSDIHGVINLRGQITTVVNLRRRLGMEDRDIDGNSRIVVVEVGGKTMGMMVDNVSEVKYIKGSQVDDISKVMAAEENQSYLLGVCKLKNNLLILIDLKKLLGVNIESEKATAIV